MEWGKPKQETRKELNVFSSTSHTRGGRQRPGEKEGAKERKGGRRGIEEGAGDGGCLL